MAAPRLFGAGYSAYVQVARLTLAEKRVAYEHVPVDVFASGGPPAWYLEHQPFGRIPAFEHDGLRLYETAAIARYVDEAFDGPALQPAPSFLCNEIPSTGGCSFSRPQCPCRPAARRSRAPRWRRWSWPRCVRRSARSHCCC